MAWGASLPWLSVLAVSALAPLSRSDLSIRVRPGSAASSSTTSNAENVIDNSAVNNEMNDRMSVYSQSIAGNSSTETVQIDYVAADGATVTSLTDFRMQSQVVRVIVPGEEELGQPRFQAFCFVSSFSGDLIAPEAVMKLRQKNPLTVRIADEDRGEVVQDSNLLLSPSPIRLASVSSHLASFCRESRDKIFSSEHELYNILDSTDGPDVSSISHTAVTDYDKLPRCFAADDRRQPCICSLQVCIDWYPCALKYCRNREGEGEHRCGIRTCRKCTTYRFPTKFKNLCLWDEV